MTLKIITLAAISILIFCSCNNSSTSSETAPLTDSSDMGDEREISFLDGVFPGFYKYMQGQDATFDVNNFQPCSVIEKPDSPDLPQDTSNLRPFYPYLLFNSNKSMALDLVTYNYEPRVKSGKTKLEEAGPDYEAAMINFQTGKRKRLLFFGTTGTVLDARWQGDSVVFLAGTTEYNGRDSMLPVIWKYEVKSRALTQYHYPQKIHADWTGYKSPIKP